jgi:aminopeptidase-like protein
VACRAAPEQAVPHLIMRARSAVAEQQDCSRPNIGEEIFALASRLYPLNRSLTGEGVRQTLRELAAILPALQIHEVPTGTQVFDWTVPDEWNVREAWLAGPGGERIADFAAHNLHLVGYSVPVDTTVSLEELQPHLYSLPEQPHAIPYVTSYYKERWGFCLRHADRKRLKPGTYRVYIDASLAPGSLSYGELVLPGRTASEVFLSTYVCHPSMANNELSGPTVATYLAKWLSDLPARRYTYRIIFVPETLGAIAYLSRHLDHLKRYVIAGFNITCVGDERCYSYLPSRAGDTLSDRVALHVLKHIAPEFKRYTFCDRGSDERQYCAPGVDLPVASIMRSKYGEYPEYHTSLDDLTLITPAGLAGGFNALKKAIEILENDVLPVSTVIAEPQMSKRGLRPTTGTRTSFDDAQRMMMNLWVYSDGKRSLLEIAEVIGIAVWELLPIYYQLKQHGLVRELESPFVPARAYTQQEGTL